MPRREPWAAGVPTVKIGGSAATPRVIKCLLAVDFRSFAALPDPALDLLEGALLVAQDARPALDREVIERQIQELAAPLARRRLAVLPPAAQAREELVSG